MSGVNENQFNAECNICGNRQPHQLIKKFLRKDVEEYLIQCVTCGRETHSYYTNTNLRKKVDDIRKEKNPTRRAHALRYYKHKFDEFNRSILNGA